MKKNGISSLFLLIFLIFPSLVVHAQTQEEVVIEAEELDEKSRFIAQALLEDMEIENLQKEIDELLGEDAVSVKDMLQDMLQGKRPFTWKEIETVCKQVFFAQFAAQKGVMIQTLLLIIISSLFTNFSSIFKNGQVGEISFYVVYILLFTLLIHSFGTISQEITENLDKMIRFMQILTPAYFMAVIAAAGAGTASVFYEMVLILIYVIQMVMQGIILPSIHLYVLLSMVNYLHKEDFMSKMAELLKTIIEWILKTCTGIIVGWQVIQSLIAPALDSLKRTFLGKTAGAIPGIGDVMDGAAQVVVGTAVLVRNCLGAAAIIVCLLLFLVPVIRLGIIALMYKFLAAVSQPVADHRMAGCLSTAADGYILLLRVLITTEILCVLTIAILATSFFY